MPSRGERKFRPIDQRIGALDEPLPASERRLAELLAGEPSLLVTHAANELAEMAGTSKAAATRLFQRLGYKTFTEARREARDVQRWGAPEYQSRVEGAAGGGIKAHLQRDINNLSETLAAIQVGMLQSTGAALNGARRVYVVGFRNSYALALYFSRQLILLREEVILLPQPGQTLGEDLVDIGKDDLFVLIGMRRRPPQFSALMKYVSSRGARSILLADRETSSQRLSANWRFFCETGGAAQFDSYAAAMSVLNLLLNTAAQESPNRTRRLRQAEQAHQAFDEIDSLE